MSITREVTVWCEGDSDRCHHWTYGYDLDGVQRTPAAARRSAAKIGWTRDDDGRDLCPACSNPEG